MNAPTNTLGQGGRQTAGDDALGLRWAALQDAAKVVSMLAGVSDSADKQACDLPALVRDAEPWRRELAANGCADMAAMMEPGIAALLAINAKGADCQPAAQALWQEFVAARTAVLALLQQGDDTGPMRTA